MRIRVDERAHDSKHCTAYLSAVTNAYLANAIHPCMTMPSSDSNTPLPATSAVELPILRRTTVDGVPRTEIASPTATGH